MRSAAVPVGEIPEQESARSNVALIACLAAGHLVVDMNQGALPAVLPHIKTALNLSYASAGAIVLVSSVTAALVQPAAGYFSDRRVRPWMLPASLALSGLGMALTGLAPIYFVLLVLIGVMGLGVGAYHPEGFKTIAFLGGHRRTTAMSWFSVGGNVGFALGPPVISLLITHLGLFGSLGMLLPTLGATSLLIIMMARHGPFQAGSRHSAPAQEISRNMPQALGLLILIVTIRSCIHVGLMTFVPFYYIDHLKAAPSLVGPVLFVFLGAGALGTIFAGPMADRWGTRNFIVWGFLAAVPLGILFLEASGNWAILVLGLFGAVLISSFSVTVVLAQEYLPRNAGLAGGLIGAFAVGAGGLGVTLLGWVGDHFGLSVVLWICMLLPVPGFLMALWLPQPPRHGAPFKMKARN